MIAEREQIIDDLYLAALAPEKWPSVLARVARATDSLEALIATVQSGTLCSVFSSKTYADSIRFILERYPATSNQRTQRLLARDVEGFLCDGDVFSPEEMASEPIFTEHLIPLGYGSAAATAIRPPSGEIIILNVERAFQQGPMPDQALDFLNGLRPHIARAGLLASQFSLESAKVRTSTLEDIGVPAAVLDSGGRVLVSNALFATLMPNVFREVGQRLSITLPNADALLGKALANLARGDAAHSTCSIPLPQTDNAPPIIVHVSPIHGSDWNLFARGKIFIAATPVLPARIPGTSMLRGLFDLSPAEARLASLIAEGLNLEQAAMGLGNSKETARTTLKVIFAKTGTRRQLELANLLRGLTVFG